MSLKKNLFANYLGQGWVAMMQIAFVPLYIKYLGMEAYGLIGVYTVLQAMFMLMDMGMATTLNREMARFTAGAHSSHSIRELLYSVELLCIGFSIILAMAMWISSEWIALHWLQVEQLPLKTVSETIAIMGVVASVRLIEGIYRSALLGLQTQVWLNAAIAILATARWLGAVGILAWLSKTILAFFLWQACISIITVMILAFRVHRVLPASLEKIRFSKIAVLNVWRFAKGMIATTALSLVLTQTDKILLSRMLNLEAFGTYTLAATVASGLMLLVAPLAQGYYPRFTELLTRDDVSGLIKAYHQSAQLMTIMVMPVALILIFHGEAVLYLWTGNSVLAQNSAHLVGLLSLGTTFLGLMNIPYMLQLAYGWSMFAAKVNIVLVAVLIPVLLWVVPQYGAIGAAWVWLAITSSYIFVVIPIMHRSLLSKEKWAWYWQDTILPTIAVACITIASDWLPFEHFSKLEQFLWLIAIGVLSFVAGLLAATRLRNKAFGLVIKT